MLEETLEETDKPCQIFNVDETGLPLSPKPPKLLCKMGSRAFNAVTGGDKSQITIMGCVSIVANRPDSGGTVPTF